MPAPTALIRASLGVLLRAQDRTEAMIAAAVRAEAERAAAELSRKQRAERERRAAVVAAMLLAGRQMKPGVAQAIARGRAAARADAVERMHAELAAIGVDTGSLRHLSTRPLVAAARGDRSEEDRLHAESSADSLAAQWRGVAVAAALAALRKNRSTHDVVADSARLVGPRIRRTAETETSLAYNDEHEQAIRDAARYDGDVARQLADLRVMREWSAMIDACPNCWPLDGTRVQFDESFPGGATPGGMHARCRCIEVVVSEVVESRAAA